MHPGMKWLPILEYLKRFPIDSWMKFQILFLMVWVNKCLDFNNQFKESEIQSIAIYTRLLGFGNIINLGDINNDDSTIMVQKKFYLKLLYILTIFRLQEILSIILLILIISLYNYQLLIA